jgi:hypothetical protein
MLLRGTKIVLLLETLRSFISPICPEDILIFLALLLFA